LNVNIFQARHPITAVVVFSIIHFTGYATITRWLDKKHDWN